MMRLVRVRGDSMSPTLEPGDIVITRSTRRTAPGFIYVVVHPRLGRIVKRLGADGVLHSDSPDGTESARLGSVGSCEMIGRATLALTPRGLKRLPARPQYSPRA